MTRARAGDVAERARARRRTSSWCWPTSTSSERASADVLPDASSRAATTPACSATRARFGAHTLQADVRHDDNSVYGGNTTGRVGYALRPRRRRQAARAGRDDLPRADLQRPVFPGLRRADRSSPSAAAASRSARAGKARRRRSVGDGLPQRRPRPDRLRARSQPSVRRDPAYDFGCAANRQRARLQGATLAATGTLARVDLRANVDFLDAKDSDTGVAPAAPRRAPGERRRRLRRRRLARRRLGAASSARVPTAAIVLGGYARARPARAWRFAPSGSSRRGSLNALDRTRRAGARLPRPRPPGLDRRSLRVDRAVSERGRDAMRLRAKRDRAMRAMIRA